MLRITKSRQRTSRNLKWSKLLVIVVAWGIIGLLVSIYDYFVLQSLMAGTIQPKNGFIANILYNLGIGILAACIGGSFLTFYVHEKFRDSPYWKSIALVGCSFLVVSSFLIWLVAIVQMLIETNGTWNLAILKVYLFDPSHVKNLLLWLLVVMFTQITLQVNDKFGPQILINFILGKYHNPKEETRIFMFVDLISSTTIAERLGYEKYHLFLRDYYADITNSILNNRGDIYQYIGDEVVISWRVTTSLTDDCFRCYVDMRNAIAMKKKKYEASYGIVPDFKAGLHYGKVMMGEIGIIKRELTFSGDVLNTTSRIQGKCNEFSVKILVSDELLALIPDNQIYQRIPLGNIELRGKESRVAISTVELQMAVDS